MALAKTKKIPKTILISFRILSVVFGLIFLLTILSVIAFGFNHFFARALMYFGFAGVNAMLAFGFWKAQRWLATLLGGSVIIILVINIARLAVGTTSVIQALTGFIILGILFLATYFSRDYMEGEYKNPKVIGLFLFFLILSQVAFFFLK